MSTSQANSTRVVRIESLDQEARGVTHIEGKAVFVEGALPGEQVRIEYTRHHRRFDEAQVREIVQASAERVEPSCPHFGTCGGCSLQHLANTAQIHQKEQVLRENLRRLGGVEPWVLLPPIDGPHWGYRRKARLSVRFVAKKGRVLVGFRERKGRFVADLQRCEALHPSVGLRLEALSELIGSLTLYQRIPQIEVAVGDEQTVLVFRVLEDLEASDQEKLVRFGNEHGLGIYVQRGGPATATPLGNAPALLNYLLPEQGLSIAFAPTDFTQINAQINRSMVERALCLLELCEEDRVLDLFCGVGNFTLPLARLAKLVVGVEGEPGLVTRARHNALTAGFDNASFYSADLSADFSTEPWMRYSYDKALLDPPRAGAREIVPHLAKLGIERLVYISCNPATLARDAGLLVHQHGYQLESAGVMNMFPHTTHVEAMALFTRYSAHDYFEIRKIGSTEPRPF